MSKATTRIAGIAAGVLVAGAALTGCSNAPTTPTEPVDSGPVAADIVIGTGGQLSNADIFLGIAQGLFEEQSLTATTQILTAGSDAIPLLLKGDLNFATVDMGTAINATQQDIGITTVAPNTVGVPGEIGYAGIIAGGDSGIDAPADLEGKKVQVNQLGGTAEVLTRASIVKDGGDPDKVQFVEIAPPEAIPALQAGQVDAIVVGEPLTTIALGMGFKYVFNPEETTVPGLPTFVFVTSTAYAEANPQVVSQFQTAILAANAAANADPDAVRETAKTSTTVDPALLAQVKGLPVFGEDPITGDQVQEFIDFLVEYGTLDASATPEGSAVVWTP
jgi:NitT/TauT family transport system substrate-binding protein